MSEDLDLDLDDAETREWMDAPAAVVAVSAPPACAVPLVSARRRRRASSAEMSDIVQREFGTPGHRRAKIVCTIGPATASPERIIQLVEAGMDIARLNFSHGDRNNHEQVYRAVRQAAADTGRAVGILADLQGPKIRLGRFASGPVEWRPGEQVRITVDDVAGTHDRVSTTYTGLAEDARPGDRLLVDDGRVGLRVVDVAWLPSTWCVRWLRAAPSPTTTTRASPCSGMSVSIPALSRTKDVADPRVRAGAAGRPCRAIVRPLTRRRRPRPGGHGPLRRPAAGDREAGEAGGGSRSRGGCGCLRRNHGRPRRPRCRASA